MGELFRITILCACILVSHQQNRSCSGRRTVNGGSRVGVRCVIPFRFNGVLWTSCTTDQDPDERAWCSTKVDRDNDHVGGQGNWGYCPDDCTGWARVAERVFQSTVSNSPTFCNCDFFEQCQAFMNELEVLSITGSSTGQIQRLRKFVCDNESRTVCCANVERSLTPTSSITTTPPPRITTRRTQIPRLRTSRPRFGTTNPPQTTKLAVIPSRSFTSDPNNGRYQPEANRFECGRALPTGHILGGDEARRGEFPFAVLLGYNSRQGNRIVYKCGGTLINRRYVLTAAHCHEPNNFSGRIVEAVVGEHDVSQDPDCVEQDDNCRRVQRFVIFPSDVTVHPQWNPRRFTGGFDIALIRLPSFVTTVVEDFREVVLPACLPWRNEALPTIEHFVIGWGKIDNYGRGDQARDGVFSKILNKLKLSIVPKSSCRRAYRNAGGNAPRIGPDQFCAGGEEGRDSCNGDSGGGLLSRNHAKAPMYLRGVVSFGTSPCGISAPGVYTDVTFYMDWITENMKP